jgi:Flp pilus assembly protein TadD
LRSRELEAATADCERAVLAARAVRLAATPFERAYGGGAQSIELAVAYSNRAVLYHLAGNATKARADIATAAGFAPSADFIATNIAVIGRPSIAATAAR